MNADPVVMVESDADALARTVADQLASTLAALQAQGTVPSIVLTGGTIADKIHHEVAHKHDDRVDWSRVDVYWGDERYVREGDPDSNATQAFAAMLDALPIDPDRVHPMPVDDGTTTLDEAADAYAAVVDGRSFDVVMLGIGPDGHIASLFPGKPTLDVLDRDVVAEPDSPKPPPRRVSLTYAALNRGREVWFLVSGDQKATAVAKALGGSPVEETPASGVHGTEQTIWMLDEAAATQLPEDLRD